MPKNENAQNMKRVKLLTAALLLALPIFAQETLTLEECRAMALEHNKSLQMTALSRDKAYYERQAARSNYLPKIDFIGTYQRTSKEISLLSDEQKTELSSLGTSTVTGMQGSLAQSGLAQNMQQMAGQIIQANPQLQPLIMQGMQMADQYTQAFAQQAAQSLNAAGQRVVDAFDTDSRNLGLMSVMFTQPLYMGGKIRAYDRITHYSEELAGQKLRLEEQQIVLDVDKAYWQVVSLVNKRQLATAYRDMLVRLQGDVEKMIAEGVATKANLLTVNVKLNEAEMTLMRIDDGLVLSRMLLAQTCGMNLDAAPVLADEKLDGLTTITQDVDDDAEMAFSSRPELQQLNLATCMLQEKVKIVRSDFLPSLALTGGYMTTYPALTNGFETRFRGMWNVGVSLKMPIWSWGEGINKVRAAKTEATIAAMRYDEVKEKVQLQVSQSAFAVNEANRKYTLCCKNIENAEENLRVARLGHTEGLVPTSDLLAAQTAWVSAQSDKIDAQIDIKLTQAAYAKAIGM